MPWSTRFDDPVTLPDGRELLTLKDAANFITELPNADQQLEEWQTAVHCLIGAAESRDFLMHARVGMLRVINRHVERVFDTSRKETHWGKRKLKRDSLTVSAFARKHLLPPSAKQTAQAP